MTHSIDAQQLVRFAELIGRPCHEVRVRAFKPSGSARNELTPRKGLLSQLDEIQQWNAEGRGIYAVINAGGDDDASITSCVCLFAEWDDRPIDWQINAWQELELPPPTLQVLTGGKSAHSHWRIVPTSVEEWKPLQRRLIHHAGCDTTIKNPSRVMRAPGCWYVNGNDEHVAQAELINTTGNIYSAELFDQLLPQLPEPQTRRAIPVKRSHRVSTLSEIAAALDVIPTRVPGNGTYELYRNILWGLKAAVTDAGYSEQVAIELMEAHSPSKSCGWDVEQVANSGGSSITAGTFWHHALQSGWSRDAR